MERVSEMPGDQFYGGVRDKESTMWMVCECVRRRIVVTLNIWKKKY